jgi:AraC-like DNA-binding protein
MLRRWGAGAASQFWIGLISRRNVQESTASCYHWLRAPRPMPSAFLLGSTSSRASAISCSASSNKPCNAISARCWDSGIRRWPRSASGDETRAPHDFPVCVRLQHARRSLFRPCRGRDVAHRNHEILMYTRHNYTHFLFRKPPASNSSEVKIVEEFIEANWNKPIDIEAMSAVARTSARSLYRQFKKDRGYSPADFRQAHQARPRAGNAGASRGKRVGDPDRAEMRFPEPRPFRS